MIASVVSNVTRPAAVLAALLIAGAVHAQGQRVFRCVIDGKVTFQQQACPSEGDAKVLSIKQGSMVSQPQRPKAAVVPVAAASAASSPAQRKP